MNKEKRDIEFDTDQLDKCLKMDNKKLSYYFDLFRYCRNHEFPNEKYPKFPFKRLQEICVLFQPYGIHLDLNLSKYIDYKIDEQLKKFEEEKNEKMESLIDTWYLDYKYRERNIDYYTDLYEYCKNNKFAREKYKKELADYLSNGGAIIGGFGPSHIPKIPSIK